MFEFVEEFNTTFPGYELQSKEIRRITFYGESKNIRIRTDQRYPIIVETTRAEFHYLMDHFLNRKVKWKDYYQLLMRSDSECEVFSHRHSKLLKLVFKASLSKQSSLNRVKKCIHLTCVRE